MGPTNMVKLNAWNVFLIVLNNFKVPSREVDKSEQRFWSHWNKWVAFFLYSHLTLLIYLRETKEFFLQFSFKLSDPRGGSAVARPPPPAMVPAPPKPVTIKSLDKTEIYLTKRNPPDKTEIHLIYDGWLIYSNSGSTTLWSASSSNASRTSSSSSATTFLKSAPGVIAIILKSAVNFCKEQIFHGQ